MTLPPPTPTSEALSVLYVLSAFPVLSETFVSNEIRAMRRLGHTAVPMALGPYDGPVQPADEDLLPDILHMSDEPRQPALLGAVARPGGLAHAMTFIRAQRGLPARSLLLAGARVARAARRIRARHIHAHFAHAAAATAIVAARLAGTTVSFTGHGFDIYGAPSDLAVKVAAADFTVAVCQDMAEDMRRLAPDARIEMIPCGVDAGQFLPSTAGTSNGRLLAVGRLAPQKGYFVLLEALAMLPPERRPHVDIVGEGALRPEIEADVAARGLQHSVSLLGARSSRWIAEHGPFYLGLVAPYVITREGDRDTGPLVVKEAMAMGLPVVASALMGMKETVTPETGMLVPPASAAELAHGLSWAAGLSTEDRARIGAAARARVQGHFSLTAQARGLASSIASLARAA